MQCTSGAPFKNHNTKPVLISWASLKIYSHGGFERSSGCTLKFPSTELYPMHNFQNWIAAACEPISLEYGRFGEWLRTVPKLECSIAAHIS